MYGVEMTFLHLHVPETFEHFKKLTKNRFKKYSY